MGVDFGQVHLVTTMLVREHRFFLLFRMIIMIILILVIVDIIIRIVVRIIGILPALGLHRHMVVNRAPVLLRIITETMTDRIIRPVTALTEVLPAIMQVIQAETRIQLHRIG
ncbi:hypothetical protein BHU09_09160 [Tannerella sp. oral taxon 808]|nr:hypothetical protein BHU09_09160 [Tannerella sp. oral taxon 808]